MDSMSGSDVRLVFTFPPKDSTLQYKNAYTSEITFLALVPCPKWSLVHVHNNLSGKVHNDRESVFSWQRECIAPKCTFNPQLGSEKELYGPLNF